MTRGGCASNTKTSPFLRSAGLFLWIKEPRCGQSVAEEAVEGFGQSYFDPLPQTAPNLWPTGVGTLSWWILQHHLLSSLGRDTLALTPFPYHDKGSTHTSGQKFSGASSGFKWKEISTPMTLSPVSTQYLMEVWYREEAYLTVRIAFGYLNSP